MASTGASRKGLIRVALAAGLLLGGAQLAAQDAGRWTKGAPMPSERSEVAAAEAGGKIYVVGGLDQPGAHADRAPRSRRGGGAGQNLRHRGRADARRLGFLGQRNLRVEVTL